MWNHHLLTCATNKTKKIGGINKQSNCARPRPAVVLIPLPRAPVKAVKSKSSGKWVDFPASHVSGPRGVTPLGNYIPSTQTFQMKIPIYIWFLLVIFPWPFDLVYSWEKTHTHTLNGFSRNLWSKLQLGTADPYYIDAFPAASRGH